MDGLLLRSAEELFSRHATPAAVRAIRAGGPPGVLWEELERAGFPDALVPEEAGGIGLGPAEALPVLMAAGRFAVPLPLGETMLARAVISTGRAAAGERAPPGAILLGEPYADGARVPSAVTAAWVLLQGEDGARLLPVEEAEEDEGAGSPLGRVLRWPGDAGRRLATPDPLPAGAWAETAAMAGAMERVLESTVRHVGERRQFGRPVAAFQAVQQQVSVMTEDVFAARMAAQLASVPDGNGIAGLNPLRIAAAKLRVGEAAQRVSAIAHALHGAMGITEELDLHLLTERLRTGRMRFGGEAHWGAWLGRRFLAGNETETLAFVRAHLGPSAPEATA
ncbi:acyl-CoA dehydrogenase [Pararoseomonas sp. SCSIO 73927]|uniref:acyl-CoA dehydrogenase n=1 Tax=Pararoseomonas sp. SCSIO 73927 TaxID=3114537 RepID=UPI0030CCA08C